jgi:hypothetical protein
VPLSNARIDESLHKANIEAPGEANALTPNKIEAGATLQMPQ